MYSAVTYYIYISSGALSEEQQVTTYKPIKQSRLNKDELESFEAAVLHRQFFD